MERSFMGGRRSGILRGFFLGAALVLLSLAAFFPALGAGFVWDDDFHFSRNPLMTAPGGLRGIWLSNVFYYPLTSTSFWIMRRLWGLNPMPYHLVNILLHAANAILLWMLLRLARIPGAWLSAALFAVHPVNVQSVAWATELKNVQSGLFYLLTLVAYLNHVGTGRGGWLAGAVLLFPLALLSKTSTVVLPGVLIVGHHCLGWKGPRSPVLTVAPFAALAAVAAGMTVYFHGSQVAEGGDWNETLPQRFMLAGRCSWFYGGKLLWPFDLSFIYARWDMGGWAAWAVLFGGGLAALAGGVLIFAGGRRGAGFAALAYYGVCLLPVLNFFRMYYTRYSYVADHWQYLAGMGAFALVGAALTRMADSGPIPRQKGRAVARLLAMMLVGACACLTFRQSHAYHSAETLWRDTLKKNPHSWLALSSLGGLLISDGRAEEARPYLEEAQRLKPNEFEQEYQAGRAALAANRIGEATAHLLRAIEADPTKYDPHVILGVIRMREGRLEEALEHLARAVAINPMLDVSFNTMGTILARLGRAPEAEASFRRALEINPANDDARVNLAELLRAREAR